ncbi:hypothetical protein [uncultured Tateyamaria sp.]|uniref:hypothetical protein n=1 Tax=Tateyamaria sp. 1078 TaxID=3417464 RepID=UPI002635B9FB|nr:hypothetical protein [uncultured Tateyamaria sp.]
MSKPLADLPVLALGSGTEVAVADGSHLHILRLEGDGDDQMLEVQDSLKADGDILALAETKRSVICAVDCATGRVELHRVVSNGFHRITELARAPLALATRGKDVLVLYPGVAGEPATLDEINTRDGATKARHNVPHGTARLRVQGRSVLAIDPVAQRVHRIDPDGRCVGQPRPERPRPDRPPQDEKCGCCCCDVPEQPDRDPGRRPPERPNGNWCDPGSDGVEDGCFLYVAVGTTIVKRNICEPGRPDCRRDMHSRIERLDKLGDALVVVTKRGKLVSELDPGSLAIRTEMPLRRPATLLAAPRAARMLAISNDLSDIVTLEFNPQALVPDLNLQASISERIYEGTPTFGSEPQPQFALEDKSILIVPVVYGAQDFSGSLAAYRDALFAPAPNGPISWVQDYFDECSDEQQALSFEVFGLDSAPHYQGGPIEIDGPVMDYYLGDFVPGGMASVPSLGSSPAGFRFRGDSTRDITALSSVNAENGQGVPFDFTLDFPAAIILLDLKDGMTLNLLRENNPWNVDYYDSADDDRITAFDPGALPSDVTIVFNQNGLASQYQAECEELRAALQTMIDASNASAVFAPVEVVWTRIGTGSLGIVSIIIRFNDAPGAIPRFEDANAINFNATFGLTDSRMIFVRGWAEFTVGQSNAAETTEREAVAAYLFWVMHHAEAAASDSRTVIDPILGTGSIDLAWGGNALTAVVRLRLTETHGQDQVGIIQPGGGSGPDPLALASGVVEQGSPFAADKSNTMDDKPAFFEMLYGRMVLAVNGHIGAPVESDWHDFRDYLQSFNTVYVFPIDPPAAGGAGWSVDAEGSARSLRAFVASLGEHISDPNGIGAPVKTGYGMNFQSFDANVPAGGSTSRFEADARTFAHELGHSLGLADLYSSTKHDPSVAYVGELDIMGSSGGNWPHFCAYHKLALGWFQDTDRLEILPPPQGDTDTTRFVLVPTEWWTGNEANAARNALGNVPGDVPVVAAALCNLGGTGGILNTIEARAPGADFSAGIAPNGAPGQVIVLNALDYGDHKRYGSVITDTDPNTGDPVTVPDDAVKGLLRFRRRLHKLADNLQPGDSFDTGDATGFPFDGIEVHVDASATISLSGASVPVYDMRVVWTGGLAADVGFADNDEEWRSSDIGIDYVGDDPGNPESGVTNFPLGQPQGAGDTIIIPQSGTEPHDVVVRVHNFGDDPVQNVEFFLYLRDPGGGGELDGNEPYHDEIIDEILPVADAGPHEVRVRWDVPAGQDPHVCWRAEIGRFERDGDVIVSDGTITNNWAQQNIFETDVAYASPPDTLSSKFSVTNNGPFTETAHLVPEGLPPGARLRVRPAQLDVPPYSTRVFDLRFEFDEEMIDDPCRRDMDVLLRCLRHEEHSEELWGASMFKLHLRRRTTSTVSGTWYGANLALTGTIDPPIGVGRMRLRLDFQNGDPALWVGTNLLPGGAFQAHVDTSDVVGSHEVSVVAHYRGTNEFASSVSDPALIGNVIPAG